MKLIKNLSFLPFLTTFISQISATEYFSSFLHLKQLASSERILVEKLQDYIREQEDLIKYNRKFLENIRNAAEESTDSEKNGNTFGQSHIDQVKSTEKIVAHPNYQ